MIGYQSLETNINASFEDDRISAKSIASIQSNDSNHVVLNPDGSLMKAIRYNAKLEEERQLQTRQNGNQVVYIVDDDEIIFYANANEVPAYFDEFVGLFIKHLRFFFIFIISIILIEIICGVFGYFHKEQTLDELQQLYPRINRQSLARLYEWTTIIDACFSVVYYSVGLIALFRRSSKFLGYFTTLSMVGLIIEMILAYVNKFNFFIFLWRFVALVYSRFLNQILISVLLIPRVVQGNGAGNNNNGNNNHQQQQGVNNA